MNLRSKITFIYTGLAAANIAAWLAAIALFHHYPVLLGTAFLAYSFGLRHAVDADHIAAIDNVTRKLMQEGQRPVGVGFFFSLGHSTIVVVLSAVVALSAITIQSKFAALENFGGIIGTLISAGFLFALAFMNILILRAVFATFRRVKAGGVYQDEDLNLILARRGFFGRLFRNLFRLVHRSWMMYPVGLLFGLGFDTATEIGLLGISAAEASKGLNIWAIMLFPALFTAGMALIDTTDSILMLNAYGWAFTKPIRKLFYNLTITAVSVFVALLVGSVETLGLIQSELNLTGNIWNAIATINNHFGLLGYLIIATFVLAWLASILVYKLNRYDEIEVNLKP
jgi:high-affinity nickel-transport protein